MNITNAKARLRLFLIVVVALGCSSATLSGALAAMSYDSAIVGQPAAPFI